MSKLKKYTVILIRPEELATETRENPRLDTYVALVTAIDPYDAVRISQLEVQHSDIQDGLTKFDPEKYRPLHVFEGHYESKIYGWSVENHRFQR